MVFSEELHGMVFLVLFRNLLCAQTENVVVQRRRDMNDINGTRIYQPDTLRIPPAMCLRGDGSALCTAMGGQSIGNCTCECTSQRATFRFYDNQWNCTENSKVRQHGGCSLILLRNQTETSPLITVPTTVQEDTSYEMSTGDLQRCYIIAFNSTYLKCDDTWEKLDNNFVFDRFSTKGDNGPQFFVFKNTTELDPSSLKAGRVMRMEIGCYNKPNAIIRHCLLLKMEGEMTCPPPTPKPSTSASKPPPPTSTVPVTATTAVPATLTSTNEPQTDSSYPSTNRKDTEARHSKPTIVTSPNFVDEQKKTETTKDDDDSIGLIAGTLAGVIGLALIIVAIVIVTRRRKKRNATVAKSTPAVENSGYELGVDNSLRITSRGQGSLDKEEYSYAYVNPVPANRRNVKESQPYNQDPQIAVANHVYGKVEDMDKPGNPPHLEAPVYNTLEPPEYAKVNNPRREYPSKSDAPIYNTLEDPNDSNNHKGRNPKTSSNQNEPLYNVLEGPESMDDAPEERELPCYHVLEGPYPEGAPVYKSLGEQDPRVYGTLDRRDGYAKGPPKESRGYNDILYDSVDGVINDAGDIYQQLNQDSQRNLEVYQTLNHPDNTFGLNELSSYSNA